MRQEMRGVLSAHGVLFAHLALFYLSAQRGVLFLKVCQLLLPPLALCLELQTLQAQAIVISVKQAAWQIDFLS